MLSLVKANRYNINYGKYIQLNNKNICVRVIGSSDEAVVLMPGMGCCSPVYEFLTFANILSKKYKVIIIENFGYGLSDFTDKERTIDNIVEETHFVLDKLCIKKYVLMAHSVWGIYALYYAEKYADEVKAFVGIDSTYPKFFIDSGQNIKDIKLGPTNIFGKIAFKAYMLKNSKKLIYNDIEGANWSKNDIKLQKQILYRNLNNTVIQNEMKNAEYNLNKAMNLIFNMPVLFFLSSENVQSSQKWQKNWEEGHKEILGLPDISKIEILDGGHYLHYKHADRIAEDFDNWYQSLKYVNKAQ